MENQHTYTQAEIIESISACVGLLSPKIRPTQTLKMMVYHILKSYFIDNKKYVIANCPTGSGKTIIGFMTYFCMQYLETKKVRPEVPIEKYAYFLTSNKALQEQINNDITKFEFDNYLTLLKGTDNYSCTAGTKKYLSDEQFREKFKERNPNANFVSYKHRLCAGLSGERLQKKFAECFPSCPYKCAREEAANKSCSVLNYAYFLNANRGKNEFGKFFTKRTLTICDEAHLIPDIVCGIFNYEFTNNILHRIKKLIDGLVQSYGIHKEAENAFKFLEIFLQKCFAFFSRSLHKNESIRITQYLNDLIKVNENLQTIFKHYSSKIDSFIYNSDFDSINETLANFVSDDSIESVTNLIAKRPNDVYIESEFIQQSGNRNSCFKHILKDLSEAEMIQNNFIKHIDFGLFMSATIGNVDEYAQLMGFDESEYNGLNLPSTFDFDKSPIYLTQSGYLNYKSIDVNLPRAIKDCLKICDMHKDQKGLIHTSTYQITEAIKNAVNQRDDFRRFLFYSNSDEKENLINELRNSSEPLILVGPSLYEGIDLPDDNCRFQILVKTPYAALTQYVKQKMERYPFWYKRNCIEKTIQAIGRSNRHKNDYSTIYLLDSLFDKIVYEMPDEITQRLVYKKIW